MSIASYCARFVSSTLKYTVRPDSNANIAPDSKIPYPPNIFFAVTIATTTRRRRQTHPPTEPPPLRPLPPEDTAAALIVLDAADENESSAPTSEVMCSVDPATYNVP